MDILLQIERLEALDSEIEHCLRNDELDSIQTLIDERKSRISQLLELEHSGKNDLFNQFRDRLLVIRDAGDALSRLIELKLKLLTTEIRKTGETKVLSVGYSKGSPQLAAVIRRTTDITG